MRADTADILHASAELLDQTIKYAQGLEAQLKAARQTPSPVILEKVAAIDTGRLQTSLEGLRAAGLMEPSGISKVAAMVAENPNTLLDVVDRLTSLHTLSDTPSGVGISKAASALFTQSRRDEDPDGWGRMRDGA